MGLFQLIKRKYGVGLDLGKNWIKVVELQGSGNKFQLNRLGRTFLTKQELEDKKNIRKKLKKLLDVLSIQGKELSISLAGHSVIIKRITLPLLEETSKTEYDQLIKKQAKEHIPFDLENVYMDYFILEDSASTDKSKAKECFLVASKKSVINELRELIEGEGFKIEGIDVEGFALCNCFEYNYPEHISSNNYLLDIGGESTIFCVYSNGTPLLIRDVSIGGNHLTEKIKEVLNKNFFECEKIKINMLHGIDPKEKILINQKIEEVYLKWIDEIQKMIFFHISNYPESKEVNNIFISGGGSLSHNFKEVMEEHLEKNVHYLNPFRKIETSLDNFDMEYLKDVAPQFVIATGLALRNFI